MYIAFKLPRDLGVAGYDFVDQELELSISDWAQRYQITDWRTKNFKFVKRLTFDKDDTYSLFMLTWQEHLQFFSEFYRPQLIVDLNNKI